MIITEVTPENAVKETLFCVKNIKSSAFECKQKWYEERYPQGLRLKILKATDGRMIGFIEYVPANLAWRPVDADNFMFIHCIYVYSKKDRNKGYGSMLVTDCEKDAKAKGMSGICAMTSKGTWMADSTIFKENGFEKVDQRGRFELMSKRWDNEAPHPKLIDWTAQQSKYNGWYLIYADQCPWHEKSVVDILNTAMDFNIDLNIVKLKTTKEAKNAPSGFGVFSLLHDGKLLEDHYISSTRFKNILKKELELSK